MTIIPPCIPWHKELVFISGFLEIIFGFMLLFSKTRLSASYGLILLLIFVFPANFYLYFSDIPRDILGISKQQALIRIPFQIPLILLAYWHGQVESKIWFSYFCIALFIPTIIYFLSL